MSVVTVEIHLTQITVDHHFSRKSILSIHVSKYLDIFIKNKASLQKHSELILLFIEAVDKFRNVCLVDYLIAVFLSAVCRKLSITCKLRTVLTLLLLTVDSMQSIFIGDK